MRGILAGVLIGLGIGAIIGVNANSDLLVWAVLVSVAGVGILLLEFRRGHD